MLSIKQKRVAISEVYPGSNWRCKCLYIFPDRQVCAIYENFKKHGQLEKPKKCKDTSVQISIWDLGVDLYGKREEN